MRFGKTGLIILFMLLLFPFWGTPRVQAEVESNLLTTLDLDKKPLDIVSDARGTSLYILMPGEVLIYSPAKRSIQGRIAVEDGVDRLAVSPGGDQIFLTNEKTKKLSVISIDFVQDIDVKGSPFKGPARAPVVIAVFSDYQ